MAGIWGAKLPTLPAPPGFTDSFKETREVATLPIAYGTCAVKPLVVYKGPVRGSTAGWRWLDETDDSIENPIWKSVAGKGADVILAVCEAPIVEFTKAYRDGKSIAAADFYRLLETWTTTHYEKTAATDSPLSTTFITWGPTDLGPMTLKNTAYVALPFMFMNEDGSVPEIKFEVRGLCLSGAAVNANPADVVIDLLTNTRYGLGLPSSAVVTDVGPDGLAASSYRNYCTAHGWGVSRVIEGGEDAGDLLESLLACTNAALVQSDGKLKIVPYGDTAKTANGATYTPPATSAVLDADEILKDPGQDPITVERAGEDSVYNCWPVRIRNRAADYKESEYESEEASHSAVYGQRRAPAVDGAWLPDAFQAAQLSNILAKRSIYARNLYRFRVKAKWAALEVMDYVSISEPVTGLVSVLCRIESIRRLRDGSLEVAAREAPQGSATAVDYTPQTEDGYSQPLVPMSIGSAVDAVAGKADADLSNVPAGSVTGTHIDDEAVTNGKIAPASVNVDRMSGWLNASQFAMASALNLDGAGNATATSGTTYNVGNTASIQASPYQSGWYTVRITFGSAFATSRMSIQTTKIVPDNTYFWTASLAPAYVTTTYVDFHLVDDATGNMLNPSTTKASFSILVMKV